MIPTDWTYDAISPVKNSYKHKIQFKKLYARFKAKAILFWVSE